MVGREGKLIHHRYAWDYAPSGLPLQANHDKQAKGKQSAVARKGGGKRAKGAAKEDA